MSEYRIGIDWGGTRLEADIAGLRHVMTGAALGDASLAACFGRCPLCVAVG